LPAHLPSIATILYSFWVRRAFTPSITGAAIAVVTAAAVVLYQMNYHNPMFTAVLALVGGFIAVMVGLQPVFDRNNIIGKHFYVVTNRRVVLAKSTAKGDFIEMPYNANTSVVVIPGDKGKGSVCIGEGVKDIDVAKLRTVAVKPKTVNKDGADFVNGMVFFNVADPQKVKNALKTASVAA